MRILVVGPSWVGDMIMADSLFRHLKQMFPHSTIDVLAPQWSIQLLGRMQSVNKAINLPFQHGEFAFFKRYQFAKTLDSYDWAIVLPNSWKSALIPYFAGIKKRTGWLGEIRFGLLNDTVKLDKTKYDLMIERFIALAYENKKLPTKPYLLPKLNIDYNNLEQLKKKFDISYSNIIAFCPGAEFGIAKMYPVEKIANIINSLQNFKILFFGSQKDAQTISEIIKLLSEEAKNNVLDLSGKTSLTDAIDLLSIAKCVISNDSGLLHVSASINTTLIAIYLSTTDSFTPPLTDNKIILKSQATCSPCFKRVCPFGHYNCHKDITETQVLDAIATLTK